MELADLSEGDGSGFEAVGLLEAGGDGGRLSGDLLGHQLFAGNLLGSRFPCCLLCSCHYYYTNEIPGEHLRRALKLEKFPPVDFLSMALKFIISLSMPQISQWKSVSPSKGAINSMGSALLTGSKRVMFSIGPIINKIKI